MNEPPLAGMDELLQRLLDGQIQPEEIARLQKAMREDRRVRDYYVESMLVSAVIRRSSQVTGELSESDLIRAISVGENHSRPKRVIPRLYRIAAVLVLGLLTAISINLLKNRDRDSAVGRLVDTYEAQWIGTSPNTYGPLFANNYHLSEGVAQVELGQGTKLLLEAPCQIELISSNEVGLRRGRLVAEVPPQAKGFRVQTLTAVITDLGTEFGVIVYPDGSTETHVVKGSISVALDPSVSPEPTSMVVSQGQTTIISPTGRAIRRGPVTEPDTRLLRLPPSSGHSDSFERLDLTDIVGGGDGQGSGTMDSCIDLGTGLQSEYPVTVIRRARKNEFIETPQFKYVDGVFVPNGALGPVVISSTGLLFSECPDTMGSYYGGPANSGKIYDIPSDRVFTARLNGIRLGTSAHPALNLHPNAGITFDLDEIRRENPDARIERFTAVCGIPRDVPQWPFSPADVWVLLDGDIHLHLRYPTGWSVVENVDVAIPAGARFLTLAATCYGPADYSWIFFGDPFLELTSP